jgi:hypothetical protein
MEVSVSLLKLKGDLLIIFRALQPDAGNVYAITHALACPARAHMMETVSSSSSRPSSEGQPH